MKKKYIIPIIIIAVFYGIIYFWNKENKSIEQHPTLHDTATEPDDYFMDVKEYEDMQRHDKSLYSLEQAIQAIWKLEKDVDDESFNRLEQTIQKLEEVHRRILRDSVPSQELLTTFEYALGNLAHAELEVAEKYSKSNQTDEAKTALRYAQLHIKNALIFHNPNVVTDSDQLSAERKLVFKMDSLLSEKDLSHPDYSSSLDHLLKEVDLIISRIGED